MIKLSNKKTPVFQKKWLIPLVISIIGTSAGVAVAVTVFPTPSLDKSGQQQAENNDNTSGIKESQTAGGVTGTELPNKSNIDTNPPSDGVEDDTKISSPEKPNLLRADYTSSLKVVATFQQPSTGYCELKLTKNDVALTYEASIVVGSNYYSCSFDVTSSKFSSKGEWIAVVIHNVGNLQTSSTSKIIEVN